MKNNLRNIFSVLTKTFNKPNFNKFLIIFIVGFVSRVFISYFYSINVYLDFLSFVSIFYYIFMSAFIVLVHEFIDYFNIVSIFSFVYEIYTSISRIIGFIVKILVSMNTRIFSYKLEDIKISSMIKGAKQLFSRDKAILYINESSTLENFNKTIDNKSFILEKNGKDESKKMLPRRQDIRESNFSRREEILQRRQQAERIAQNRARAGILMNGGINFNANTSSQINSSSIINQEHRYQESLRLAPILNDNDREILNINNRNNNLSPLEPSVNNNYNPLAYRDNNTQNNSQANNNYTNNNPVNTNNYYTNNQGNTNNNYTNNNKNSTNNNATNDK